MQEEEEEEAAAEEEDEEEEAAAAGTADMTLVMGTCMSFKSQSGTFVRSLL
jgi:hypothetical protein